MKHDNKDFSKKYNTPLPKSKVGLFEQFLSRLEPEQRSSYDYDLQGAFLEGLDNNNPNGHFSDKYKKPNHPTFSRESIYNGVIVPSDSTRLKTARGGTWVNVDGRDMFVPSKYNQEVYPADFLMEYFDKVEKENNAGGLFSILKGYI